MDAKVRLVPNPHRQGAIDRVIVIGRSSDPQRVIVLNIDALNKSPQLLARFNPGYHYATKFWTLVSCLIFIGGIVLSFIWQSWAFLAALALSIALYRANQKSVADFAREALVSDPNAANYFATLGLVWEVNERSLVVE